MFSEEFVDAATNEETLKFEKGIEESAKLDEEANMLLKSCGMGDDDTCTK